MMIKTWMTVNFCFLSFLEVNSDSLLSHILDDVEDYVDYDMDFETGPMDGHQDVDPYAGTFTIRNIC